MSKVHADYPTKLLITVGIILLLMCADASAQIREARDPDLANVLSVVKNEPDPKLKIEPVPGLERSSLVTNRAKTRKAYVLCVPATKGTGKCDSLVFVKDLVTQTIYLISGEPGGFERYRPVDSLKWMTNDVLSFERWTGPHFGHRFVVNIKLKKQTNAFSLTG
ncbi:MAG: hypothetical protein ABJB40_03590 [Acidobacteriota bacterium]